MNATTTIDRPRVGGFERPATGEFVPMDPGDFEPGHWYVNRYAPQEHAPGQYYMGRETVADELTEQRAAELSDKLNDLARRLDAINAEFGTDLSIQ
jgi:hypothetical protein